MKKNFFNTKYTYHLLNSLPHNLKSTKKQKWLQNHNKIYKFSGFSKVQPLGKLTSWKDDFWSSRGKFLLYISVQFKSFTRPWKTSCPPPENVYETLEIVSYDNALQVMKSDLIWHKCCWARRPAVALLVIVITKSSQGGAPQGQMK